MSEKKEAPFRAAIYQYQARDETPSDRIARLDHALEKAGENAFDLLVCPELFQSGYNSGDKIIEFSEKADGPFFQAVSELAKKWNTAILYGYPEISGDQLFNSAQCVSATGESLINYQKINLPSDYERSYFETGNEKTLFEINGYKLAIAVCYDAEFPENIRENALMGAEIVIVPTALVERWTFVARKMIPTRAFEHGVFLLYANFAGEENGFRYLGDSRIVAPDGEDLAVAGAEECVISANLRRQEITEARNTLPYLESIANQ